MNCFISVIVLEMLSLIFGNNVFCLERQKWSCGKVKWNHNVNLKEFYKRNNKLFTLCGENIVIQCSRQKIPRISEGGKEIHVDSEYSRIWLGNRWPDFRLWIEIWWLGRFFYKCWGVLSLKWHGNLARKIY